MGNLDWLTALGAVTPPDQAQINNAVLANGTPMSIAAPPGQMPMPDQSVPPPIPMPMPGPLAKPAAKPQPKRASPDLSAGFRDYLPQPQGQGDPSTDGYAALSKQAIADQQKQLDGLNQYINDIAAKPRGIDWSPIAAYVDNLTGSHLYQAAKDQAPMSQEDRDKMLFGLKNQLAMGQAKLSGESLDQLKAQQQQQLALRRQDDLDAYRKAMLLKGAQGSTAQEMRANTAMGNQAIGVGKDIEHDKIIMTSKQSINSLGRSVSILENQNKPLTSKDLNLAYTDYINAVAASGAATEGKINRELPETWAQKFNELSQKVGANEDLRDSAAGRQLVDMLKENIRTVRGDLNSAIKDQFGLLEGNYAGITKNPGVQTTLNKKRELYNDYLNSPEARKMVERPQAAQSSDKVTVSNGSRTFLIDRSKLDAATKDGYQVVK